MAIIYKPILFSGEMVAAILEGRKTQTRRVVKPQPSNPADLDDNLLCPYGAVGDRLWVREAHCLVDGRVWSGLPCRQEPGGQQWAYYRQGFDRVPPRRWRPSIHMPRWASRIELVVRRVQVEPLTAIDAPSVLAEGVAAKMTTPQIGPCGSRLNPHVAEFAFLWDRINAARGFSWASNPLVWVVTFERVEAPRV